MTAVQDGRLGKYEIVGTLGRGAMGTVYDGRDPVIDRRVAIKTIPLARVVDDIEAADELARFKREAQAAGRLQHPNIVGVYDYGETEAMAYIVMEFVDGTSLKAVLDRGERMTPAQTVRVMGQVLAGLQYSHERGVVHRDIKPANVMLTTAGAVKIADFGIARIESSSLTQAGTIMGTPAYMSPEQFMGQTVDARTDIYSAGVLLYQLLTGERPFEGSMTAIMHKALNTVPPRPSEISVTAPPGLDAVVATAMAKRPEQRFQTAASFAAALAEGLTAPSPAAPAQSGPDSDATMVTRSSQAPAAPTPPAPAVAATLAGERAAEQAATGSRTKLLAGVGLAAVLLAGVIGYVVLRPGAPHAPVASPSTVPPASVPPARVVAPVAPIQARPSAAPPPQVAPATIMPAPVASSPAPASLLPPPAPTLPPLRPAATSSPASPPTPAPPARPVQLATAETPASLRAAVKAAIAPVGCALLTGDIDTADRVQLGGVISRDNAAKLRSAVSDAARATTDWHVATFNGPYCGLLDVLRPIVPGFAQPHSGLRAGLKSGDGPLRKDAYLIPRIAMPDWPAYLTLDYFTSDGRLAHLYPASLDKSHAYPARAQVVIGDPADHVKGWQVDVPFGTDMMVAIASSRPLFAKPRPPDETTEAYLSALKGALDEAAHRGERVAASAAVVQTVEK